MRLTPVLRAVAVLVLLGLVTVGGGTTIGAQEGTPAPSGFEIAPGVTAEGLAFAAGQEVPSLYRLTFAPGVTYAVVPAPEISLVYVESGELALMLDAPVTITRAGMTDAPGENVAADTELTLAAGDYAVLPLLVGGEVRNDGQEPASVMVAAIAPSGMMPPGAATPAP
jgi:hypothetical protein